MLRRTRADRSLEASLLLTLVMHVVALCTMALILLPGIPQPVPTLYGTRLAYIHSHAMLWHLGWLPWHACALSDLLLSIALVRARRIPRWLSVPTLLLTLAAFGIEQPAELRWNLLAPGFHVPEVYSFFEDSVFTRVCVVAATIYAVMAVGWSLCLARGSRWTPLLTILSWITWPALLFGSLGPVLPVPQRLVTFANQAGFLLMTLWFFLALEAVLRRTRVDEPTGRMMPWAAPQDGLRGRALEWIANSRALQYAAEFLPKPALASNIHDVVYLNYLVPSDKAATLLPQGLTLQRLGPAGEWTMLSVLTYRHGRFGPRVLGGGGICRGFPSPFQSNWRLYVREPVSGVEGIYFLTTLMSRTPAAVMARVLSRGVPMHRPAGINLQRQPEANGIELCIFPVRTHAPALKAGLWFTSPESVPELPEGTWRQCFSDYAAFIDYTVPQDRAISVQSWDGRITAQEIELVRPVNRVEPLAAQVRSTTLASYGATGHALAFLIPHVRFTLRGERVLRAGTVVE